MSLTLLEPKTNTATESETVDLQHYFRVIQRFKWRILSLSILVTLLTSVIIFSITPQYTSTATLLIQTEKANIVSIEEVYGLESNKSEYFFTQFEILKSQELATRVVDKLNLIATKKKPLEKEEKLLTSSFQG